MFASARGMRSACTWGLGLVCLLLIPSLVVLAQQPGATGQGTGTNQAPGSTLSSGASTGTTPPPGSYMSYPGDRSVFTSNGGSFQYYVNGKSTGPYGQSGPPITYHAGDTVTIKFTVSPTARKPVQVSLGSFNSPNIGYMDSIGNWSAETLYKSDPSASENFPTG